MTHKKHYSEEGQMIRFIDASITTSIRNQIDNPSKRPEVAEKISEKAKIRMKGEGNIMFGKHHSEETKRKLHLRFWKQSSNHRTYYSKVSCIAAEKFLGRKLLPNEVVHHLDHNPSNNNPDNLYVFESNSEHIRYHRLKEMWIIEEIESS